MGGRLIESRGNLPGIITPEEAHNTNRPDKLWVYTSKYGETLSTLRPGFNKEVRAYKGEYVIQIPDQVREICREIYGLGGAVLLVGGCVRDAVLSKERPDTGVKTKDFDLEVYGISPETLQHVLEVKFGKIDAVGKAFGVLKVNISDSDEPTDVSIPRRDSKSGNGHKGFEIKGDPSMSVSEAAARRDLTMNALAYDPLTDTLYDAYAGVEDIKRGIIEITDEKDFQDDPLRVLRVMQFAARFGFAVSEKTKALCRSIVERGELDPISKEESARKEQDEYLLSDEKPISGDDIAESGEGLYVYRKYKGISFRALEKKETESREGIPIERITEELKKMLIKGVKPSIGLEFARETGITERYWPELHALIGVPQEREWHPEGDVWAHTLQVVDAAADIARCECLSEQDRLTLILSALCHDLGKATTTVNSDGRWKAHGHEIVGVEPANSLLGRLGFPDKNKKQVAVLVPEHMNIKVFYDQEASGKKMDRALNRLAFRLSKGDATLAILSMLVEADQRGRNGEGTEPLHADQVAGLKEWQSWLSEKAKTLKIGSSSPEPLISGKDIIAHLSIKKGDVWFGAVLGAIYQDQLDGIVVTVGEAIARISIYKEQLEQFVREEAGRTGADSRKIWEMIVKSEDPREFIMPPIKDSVTSHNPRPDQSADGTADRADPVESAAAQNHPARLKLFGEHAQRISKDEYPQIIEDIMTRAEGLFAALGPVEQLSDKESFGDLDFVCLPVKKTGREFFEELYGDSLKDYHRNGNIHSLLLNFGGKTVQADFIHATDEADYKRKMMYFSKGHISSVIGVLSKNLNFKYGTEGFFKRFKDGKGNWHDVLVAEDLTDGLRMLGLNPEEWKDVHTIDDIIRYIASSPYFASSYYEVGNMVKRDREQAKRNPSQRYIMENLVRRNMNARETDSDAFFRQLYPDAYERYMAEVKRINEESRQRALIDGKSVMGIFGLPPGPDVGWVLRYIHNNYPDATEITDAMKAEIDEEIKKKKQVAG